MTAMIQIHGPHEGKFIAQFLTADGRSLAILVPEEQVTCFAIFRKACLTALQCVILPKSPREGSFCRCMPPHVPYCSLTPFVVSLIARERSWDRDCRAQSSVAMITYRAANDFPFAAPKAFALIALT
jgi:hypothetical protein